MIDVIFYSWKCLPNDDDIYFLIFPHIPVSPHSLCTNIKSLKWNQELVESKAWTEVIAQFLTLLVHSLIFLLLLMEIGR